MVYNADEGLFNALNDWAHKFFSPETYECPLCRYTYGMTGMRTPWKNFIDKQPFPTVFLYRPDFWKKYPELKGHALPLILVEKAGRTEVIVTATELQNTGGMEALIDLVQHKLEGWQPSPDGPGTGQIPQKQG